MGSLDNLRILLEAIDKEDRLLRQRLTGCPAPLREMNGPEGSLSFKATLAHIAFWDDFTINFFTRKLDEGSCNLPAPVDFEERSAEALAAAAQLPFGEVLARYLEATGALTDFLRTNWDKLSDKQRNDFWVPLKHRRHHRIALFKALDQLLPSGELQGRVAGG
jgi:hypothetical protein